MDTLKQDHSVVPILSIVGSAVAELSKLNLSHFAMVLIVAAALAYSGIQAWHDIQERKLPQLPAPPKP